MSVTEAAKRLGVGRPALSNLLNANSSLSPDMAIRLEKTFGTDRQELLKLQEAFARHDRRGEEKSIAVHSYVPAFLTIKAHQIQAWADDINARHMMPVLLRKLVHSTGQELLQVDFPGYDNAQRMGWDGLVEAGAATAWIPQGKSCWEFGVNQNPRSKAENDYATRLRSTSSAERRECTFVFVTPRNWPGKTKWARSKYAAGDWMAVRAFDASDLEQWVEESISAQIWLAEKLDIPVDGFESLDGFWQRWAAASDPSITPAIFAPSINAHRSTFKKWLEKQSERPFVVTADSKGEALAFLACLFQDSAIAPRSGDLAAVFESAQRLRTLATSTSPFIPIVCTERAEHELATAYRRHHCIVVRPRNAIDSKPDIALDLLDHDGFVKALAAMGIERDKAERFARESGRSPTILRRRLSKIDAIRTPQWAGDAGIARSLIPMALIGAWHAQTSADREVVETLSGRSYQKIEESVTDLRERDDSPVWSVREYRGVASKIDALFAINRKVTEKDLTDFFLLAKIVLSETEPALELPEDKRWAASLYGKVRKHSAALREGVCETLVILSVHGNNLFQERLGIDVEAHVSTLIHRLLSPLTLDKLLSQDKDIPRYAEAAPTEFLTLLKTDLDQTDPVLHGLMKPADAGMFGGFPQRTGLLWALECLAWNPQYLSQVSLLLAQLSRTSIDDNWMNKPIHSLKAIFRSWMPQTAAPLEERMRTLKMLTERFPDIGWQLCIEQFTAYQQIGFDSYRPRWRSDASGAGQPVTAKEISEFTRKALELVLAWPKHNQRTLCDLVERIQGLSEEDQAAVWDRIDAWAASQVDDIAKASLRERIRRSVLMRRGQQHELADAIRDRARRAYAKLQPGDSVIRHAWLFASPWVEFSADDIHNGELDYDNYEEKIHRLREATMREIWMELGFDGVTTLLSRGSAAHVVGHSLGLILSGANDRVDFLRCCLSVTDDRKAQLDGCIEGFLRSVKDDERDAILSAVAEGGDAERTARLFRCAPFGQNTWRLLDGYGKQVPDRYWQEVLPDFGRHSEAESIELIDRLLEAGRPRAAFHAVQFGWARVETLRLKRLLHAVATVTAEPEEHYRLDAYRISEALNSLNGRPGVSPDEMAQLEFMYIRVLDRSKHGIPNLERQVAESPATFFQALAFACKRRDHGDDPPELRIRDPERRAGMAVSCHRLLDKVSRIPGTGKDGKIDAEALSAWVMEVRRLCAQHDRIELGDQYIGQLLSNALPEEDGVWPCRAVCEVMESLGSQHMGTGFNMGVYKSRGVQERENGGGQERVLAKKYRDLAGQCGTEYPYVSRVLESIARTYDHEAKHWDIEAEIEKRREV